MSARLTFNTALESHDVYDGGRMVFSSQVEAEAIAAYQRLAGVGGPVETSECRRITDPAPEPYAVEKAVRRTCIEMLAEGFHHANDMCPSCTRQFMAALDGIAGPLTWHEEYRARAAEGVAS